VGAGAREEQCENLEEWWQRLPHFIHLSLQNLKKSGFHNKIMGI
jgi:hypothetical protein